MGGMQMFFENEMEVYFPLLESEGFDRRSAVLDIGVVFLEGLGVQGEIFDTVTGQRVWLGTITYEENALDRANEVLEKLERINGFGSLSLA